ncbi:MAG: SDR family NAD(P)-dependent oxidoreductase, partial [Anaerolineales bacterium]|nr:SDR family NAD(P)-dependent oxidoreductase [Anaerolineales bacterium]
LLTGASTPLAEAIAVALAGQGVKLCVSGPWAERVEAVVAAVGRAGGEAVGVTGPLETLAQAEALVARAEAAFGAVDLVIWVTPFWNGGFIHEHAVTVWDRVLAGNLREPFLLARAVLPVLRRQGSGQIVAVGSDSSLGPYARDGAYNVALHGLNALMDLIRVENAEHGIRVHVLAPGLAQTQPLDADGRPNLTTKDVADWVLWALTRPSHLRPIGPIVI